MDKKVGGSIITRKIEVSGLVQGVGFRPFVYRLAEEHQLKGWVENRTEGILIHASGSETSLDNFRDALPAMAPQASDIETIIVTDLPYEAFKEFTIRKSQDLSNMVTEISPDIAVCDDCLADMGKQEQRLDYPFINCTNCGPRFSIIKKLPYDRPNTSMDIFKLCPECRQEYEDIKDRRFHAQPVACEHCGPTLLLCESGKQYRHTDTVLEKIKAGLMQGKVYAIKGIGGFHLMCDAFHKSAVKRLREIKKRDGKPFALMFSSLEEAGRFVEISKDEEELLHSWQRPIVLLKKRREITEGIADGLSRLGIMLPYMPFHHLLFREIETPGIVLTSGNLSDEPILICNTKTYDLFENIVDGIVTYNREIINRNDDSVAAVMGGNTQLIRRSRGFAPAPIRTHLETEGIFAAGAELVSSFCIGKGRNALMSQYLGDMKNLETYNFYKEVYELYTKLFRFRPEMIVHDMHPDYLSTKFSHELSQSFDGIEMLPVQHHHAHLASVMLAHGIEGNVIGVSLDGMGMGSDGKIWGAEIMRVGYKDFERLYHFAYMPMPGGDKASKEAWRMAIAYLYRCFGDEFVNLPLKVLKEIDPSDIQKVKEMINKGINTPQISSAGRLFDAVSAILGLNYRATYQAEAPMLLESIVDVKETGRYGYELIGREIIFEGMIREIIEDYINARSAESIAGKFHNTLAESLFNLVKKIKKEQQLNRVVLSGGSFQNRILTEKLLTMLEEEALEVYLPGKVPVNDQGIAMGQLAIGAAMRS